MTNVVVVHSAHRYRAASRTLRSVSIWDIESLIPYPWPWGSITPTQSLPLCELDLIWCLFAHTAQYPAKTERIYGLIRLCDELYSF